MSGNGGDGLIAGRDKEGGFELPGEGFVSFDGGAEEHAVTDKPKRGIGAELVKYSRLRCFGHLTVQKDLALHLKQLSQKRPA